ncbi:MAG: GNAT family N-acetyltransferase [Bacteroidetes bacterium]|nr:GNAT family N-acetyltransferase [Bacteroidota bacterium]MBS1650051.1 GNAT family N-acetyltransferase [Bacteroidota bacterium]
MKKIIIRAAIINDIEAIQNIAFSTWPIAYSAILSKEQLQYMLNMFYSKESLITQINDQHYFLIAEANNSIIGFASFNQLNINTYKLQKLYVLPSEQKTGAGKLLLNEVIRLTKEAGKTKLQLNVNRHNKAIGFYEKLGFEIIKEDDIDIGKNYYMNDYVMELNIK